MPRSTKKPAASGKTAAKTPGNATVATAKQVQLGAVPIRGKAEPVDVFSVNLGQKL